MKKLDKFFYKTHKFYAPKAHQEIYYCRGGGLLGKKLTILTRLIKKKVTNSDAMWLIEEIIKSFEKEKGKGLSLGNVTSQLFANIYLNELDQFVKHELKAKCYLRYCDDFIILSKNTKILVGLLELIKNFLNEKLKLKLHSGKVILRKHNQGFDFLGYVVLPYHRVLRTKTKKRILKKLENKRGDFQKRFY